MAKLRAPLDIKSFYKERSSRYWAFLCPLCACQRRVPFRPKPGGVRHVGQIFLTAAFFTCISWPLFGWKGIVSFVPFWTIFEMAYRTRVRAALVCQACGFDPFLYLVDVKRARADVEAHWRKKFAEKGIPYPEKKSQSGSPRLTPESTQR